MPFFLYPFRNFPSTILPASADVERGSFYFASRSFTRIRTSACFAAAGSTQIEETGITNDYRGDFRPMYGRDRWRTLRMLSEINWGNFRVKKLFAMDMAVNQVFIWMDWVEIGGVG